LRGLQGSPDASDGAQRFVIGKRFGELVIFGAGEHEQQFLKLAQRG
jgi:hypothetical protein